LKNLKAKLVRGGLFQIPPRPTSLRITAE